MYQNCGYVVYGGQLSVAEDPQKHPKKKNQNLRGTKTALKSETNQANEFYVLFMRVSELVICKLAYRKDTQ